LTLSQATLLAVDWKAMDHAKLIIAFTGNGLMHEFESSSIARLIEATSILRLSNGLQELYLESGCAFLLDDSRADKSSIAPKVVINNTAPGPPSGTLLTRAVDVVDVGAVCEWARTGRIKVAAAKAQALPIWL
jgi:hypothetical protein